MFTTHLLADGVIAQLVPALERRGISAIFVKGIVTARLLYDDVSERPISDIDLRVRPHDLPAVRAVGASEGWELLRASRTYRNLVFRVQGMPLDVEASVGPPGMCSLSIEAMLSRSVSVQGAFGGPLRAPEVHDHALLLCVNAFKDKLTRSAPWALDDLARIAAMPSFDARRFVALGASTRSLSIVWVVASYMADEAGDARWRAIRDLVGHPPRPLFARAYATLRAFDDDSLALRLLARAASDRRIDQVRGVATALAWELEERVGRASSA